VEKLNIYQKHLEIIHKLKAPKGRYNSFGNFYSRNIEDIYKSLKPLLKEYGCTLKIDNEMEVIQENIYRISIATLFDTESSDSITTKMYTRECLNHKKMSPEQMSGTTASYGDKYAIGKLFNLDDSLDPDEIPEDNPKNNKVSSNQQEASKTVTSLKKKLNELGWVNGLTDEVKLYINTKVKDDRAYKLLQELNKGTYLECNDFIKDLLSV